MEFLEDVYENDPKAARQAIRDLDGEFTVETGDPIVDKWERAYARGEDPDLSEGLTPEEEAALLDRHQRILRDSRGFVAPKSKVLGGDLHNISDRELLADMTPHNFSDDMTALTAALKGNDAPTG